MDFIIFVQNNFALDWTLCGTVSKSFVNDLLLFIWTSQIFILGDTYSWQDKSSLQYNNLLAAHWRGHWMWPQWSMQALEWLVGNDDDDDDYDENENEDDVDGPCHIVKVRGFLHILLLLLLPFQLVCGMLIKGNWISLWKCIFSLV